MSDRSLPAIVRFREGGVNRMKFVVEHRIVDCNLLPIGSGDGNLL